MWEGLQRPDPPEDGIVAANDRAAKPASALLL